MQIQSLSMDILTVSTCPTSYRPPAVRERMGVAVQLESRI